MKKVILTIIISIFSLSCLPFCANTEERSSFPILIWWVPWPSYKYKYIDDDSDYEAGSGDNIKIGDFNLDYPYDYSERYDEEFIRLWHDDQVKGPGYDSEANTNYIAITMHLGSTSQTRPEKPIELCDTVARAGFDSVGGVDAIWWKNQWENYWYFSGWYQSEIC